MAGIYTKTFDGRNAPETRLRQAAYDGKFMMDASRPRPFLSIEGRDRPVISAEALGSPEFIYHSFAGVPCSILHLRQREGAASDAVSSSSIPSAPR